MNKKTHCKKRPSRDVGVVQKAGKWFLVRKVGTREGGRKGKSAPGRVAGAAKETRILHQKEVGSGAPSRCTSQVT